MNNIYCDSKIYIKQLDFKMKHGIFGFLGNKLQTSWIDTVIWLSLILCFFVFIMIYKIRIYKWYNKKDRVYLFKIAGAFLILMNITRESLLINSGYPYEWEFIPLHLCRLCFTLLGFFLFFGKIKWIKYIVLPGITGALMATSLNNLSSTDTWIKNGYPPFNQGVDNYFYWDYFLTHSFIVVFGILLWTAYGWKFSLKNLIKNILYLNFFAIFIFLFNLLLNLVWKSQNESINYLFLGYDSFSFGTISKWPYNLPLFSLIGWTIYFIFWSIWLLQTNFDFINFMKRNYFVGSDIVGKWNIPNTLTAIFSKKNKL